MSRFNDVQRAVKEAAGFLYAGHYLDVDWFNRPPNAPKGWQPHPVRIRFCSTGREMEVSADIALDRIMAGLAELIS